MSDIEFGDDAGADDAYCADGEPDDEQVSRRLHELRAWLAEAHGDHLAAWDALPEPEREIGRSLVHGLIAHLLAAPDADVDTHAEALHVAVSYLDGQPTWHELDPPTREIATTLVGALIDWLRREGTLR